MDNLFHQGAPNTQQPGGFLFRLKQIFEEIINWLVYMFELTNEDKENAGIYRGEGRD